jgi:hypothetical protein
LQFINQQLSKAFENFKYAYIKSRTPLTYFQGKTTKHKANVGTIPKIKKISSKN